MQYGTIDTAGYTQARRSDVIKSNFERLVRKKSYEEDRKISLRTIALETELNLQTVHRIKNGRMERVYLSTLDKLCAYFNVKSIAELIEYQPDDSEKV